MMGWPEGAGRVVAQGARVTLRRFGPEDVAGFYAMNADPRVLRYTGDRPFADETACRAFLLGYAHYHHHGFGRWSLALADGRYAGFCGLRRTAAGVDLGFRLPYALWGEGLASEAAALALELGFDTYHLDRIIGRARVENLASCRVLEKLGMTPVDEVWLEGQRWRGFELSAPDWRGGFASAERPSSG